MSKYIACGLMIAVIASMYSYDPLGEAIKGICTGIIGWYLMGMMKGVSR
jgi:1,4-dihydroxy-2-naphthoate octaprenyltransferase